jgi:hypothetical protein
MKPAPPVTTIMAQAYTAKRGRVTRPARTDRRL